MENPSVSKPDSYPDGLYRITNKYWIDRTCSIVNGRIWIYSTDLGLINTHATPQECIAKGCTLTYIGNQEESEIR